MLQRLLITGLLSGAIAGVVLTLVHLTMVQPLIVKAELYEQGSNGQAELNIHTHKSTKTHSHAGSSIPHLHEDNFHIHAEGLAHLHPHFKKDHSHNGQTSLTNSGETVHSHDDDIWTPEDGIERSLYSLGANILTAIAFALLLTSGFIIYGSSIATHQGLLWGFGGFICFTFLPGIGLPPELPASAAGDLLARQIWWLGTAAANVVGLSLIVFGGVMGWRVTGVVLLIVPHLIGAPMPEAGEVGASSPELASHFVMLALFASSVMWAVIGLTTAFFYNRFADVGITTFPRSAAG